MLTLRNNEPNSTCRKSNQAVADGFSVATEESINLEPEMTGDDFDDVEIVPQLPTSGTISRTTTSLSTPSTRRSRKM